MRVELGESFITTRNSQVFWDTPDLNKSSRLTADARVSAPKSAETPYAGTAMQPGPYFWHPNVARNAADPIYPGVLKRNSLSRMSDTDPAL